MAFWNGKKEETMTNEYKYEEIDFGFTAVDEEELSKLKLIVTERSSGHKPSENCDVYIVNTYGEMSKFLRLSNVTFIGGSLVNHGGQNPLEAVRMGNYVMHGKKVNNFKEIYKLSLIHI